VQLGAAAFAAAPDRRDALRSPIFKTFARSRG